MSRPEHPKRGLGYFLTLPFVVLWMIGYIAVSAVVVLFQPIDPEEHRPWIDGEER